MDINSKPRKKTKAQQNLDLASRLIEKVNANLDEQRRLQAAIDGPFADLYHVVMGRNNGYSVAWAIGTAQGDDFNPVFVVPDGSEALKMLNVAQEGIKNKIKALEDENAKISKRILIKSAE